MRRGVKNVEHGGLHRGWAGRQGVRASLPGGRHPSSSQPRGLVREQRLAMRRAPSAPFEQKEARERYRDHGRRQMAATPTVNLAAAWPRCHRERGGWQQTPHRSPPPLPSRCAPSLLGALPPRLPPARHVLPQRVSNQGAGPANGAEGRRHLPTSVPREANRRDAARAVAWRANRGTSHEPQIGDFVNKRNRFI